MTDDNTLTPEQDKLRYDLTLTARKIAKDNFTKKSISKERQKHYEEVVRDPQFVKYIQSLQSNTQVPAPVKPSAENESVYASVDYDNDFIPYRITDKYVDVNGLKAEVLSHITHSSEPLMLTGDKGVGKTAVVHEIASELYDSGVLKGLVTMQGNYNTADKHIIGYNRLRGLSGETVKGFAVNLIECANYHAPNVVIGLVDELQNMPVEISLIFASLLDGRRMIQTTDGKVWRLNKDARLAFIATGNPSHYQGVNQLQEALLSRFTGFYIPYPSTEHLKQIVDWSGIPEDPVTTPLLQLCGDIHALKQKGDVEYAISPRDLIQFTNEYRARDQFYKPKGSFIDVLKVALEKTILFKYQDLTERELVKRSINDTFDISMTYKFE